MIALEIAGIGFFSLGALLLFFVVTRIILSFGGIPWPLLDPNECGDVRHVLNSMPESLANLIVGLVNRGIDVKPLLRLLNSPGLLMIAALVPLGIGIILLTLLGPNPPLLGEAYFGGGH